MLSDYFCQMAETKFERMMQLVEKVFDNENDPDQLNVDDQVMKRLMELHPASIAEYDDDGPVVWSLVMPTTVGLMWQFITKKITERELFELTPVGAVYDALYLCTALVLEEYRRKGFALRLMTESIEKIRKDHPVKVLFVWPFTEEGNSLAAKIANQVGLPLLKREEE